jgi:nickel superoxide dismutase
MKEEGMKSRWIGILAVFLVAAASGSAFSHCEIPCGIYDDRMRIDQIREHIDTIEKSMKMVEKLSGSGEKNYNQIVRWVVNKEQHAEKLQYIVYQYFMNQRIKPAGPEEDAYDHYLKKLELLHRLLVAAMKSKQTLDMKHIEKMRELTDSFEKAYFE